MPSTENRRLSSELGDNVTTRSILNCTSENDWVVNFLSLQNSMLWKSMYNNFESMELQKLVENAQGHHDEQCGPGDSSRDSMFSLADNKKSSIISSSSDTCCLFYFFASFPPTSQRNALISAFCISSWDKPARFGSSLTQRE